MIRPLQNVTYTNVKITDGFWAKRQRANAEISIPHIEKQCRRTGRIDVWSYDPKTYKGEESPHVFWDSDLAKWLEAAAYSLHGHDSPKLRKIIDEVVTLICNAQQSDGYLNSFFIFIEPENRWKNLRDKHELYCAGHLIEAAIAVFQATGDRRLLDAVEKYAALIAEKFGTSEGQVRGVPGHEEIELALVKLWRETGKKRYLNLAKYFVEERGRTPHYFDREAVARGEQPEDYWAKTHEYTQSHIPVREQVEPVGHAVRGMYLYAAMADLAVEFDDDELLQICRKLLDHAIEKRMYVTGGIGASSKNEGHTADYDLPNAAAYAETCAAISLVFFAQRMLQITRDGKYGDVIERAIYNGILSGVSLAGDRFFYTNPLESTGDHQRQPWFSCACCPPNIARLLASFGEYLFGVGEREIFVHQYAACQSVIGFDDARVGLNIGTDYPFDEKILIQIDLENECEFTLALRIPGWCKNARFMLNNQEVASGKIEKGYAKIRRVWRDGDCVELILPTPVLEMKAHPKVSACAGRVALQRGPVVYCLEQADNGEGLHRLVLPAVQKWAVDSNVTKKQPFPVIKGLAFFETHENEDLYVPDVRTKFVEKGITAVPYFSWGNREPGEMLVWLRKMASS